MQWTNLGTKPFKIMKSSYTAALPIDSIHPIINLHCHGTNPSIKDIDIAWYSTILHHFPLDPQKHRGSVPSNGDGQIGERLRRWCRLPGRQPPGMLVVGLVSWIKTQTILATQPNHDCYTDTDAKRFLDRGTPTWIVLMHTCTVNCVDLNHTNLLCHWYSYKGMSLGSSNPHRCSMISVPHWAASLKPGKMVWQPTLQWWSPWRMYCYTCLFITYKHLKSVIYMSQWDGDEIWSTICIFVRVRVGISSTKRMLRENLCLADPRYPSRSRATMLYEKYRNGASCQKQSKLQLWGVRFLRFHVLYSIANSLQSIAVQSWTLLECSSNTSIIHYNSLISKFRGILMRSLLASSISMSACSSSTAAVFSSVGSQQEAGITGRVWVTRVWVPLILWGHLGTMFLNNQRIHRSWNCTNLDWDRFVAETNWLHLTVPLTSVQTTFLQCTSMLWVRVFHSIFAQAATARFALFVLISLLQWSRMRVHGAQTVVYWWSWRWDWVSHDMVSPFPQTMFGESWKAWTGWCTLRQTYTYFGLVGGQTYFFLLSLFWSLLFCPDWWKVKRSQTTTGSNEPDLPWRNRIYIQYCTVFQSQWVILENNSKESPSRFRIYLLYPPQENGTFRAPFFVCSSVASVCSLFSKDCRPSLLHKE